MSTDDKTSSDGNEESNKGSNTLQTLENRIGNDEADRLLTQAKTGNGNSPSKYNPNAKSQSDESETTDNDEDKATEATGTDDDSVDESRVAYYQCPFCEVTEENETELRKHITREDDFRHADRHGFDNRTSVIAYDGRDVELGILKGGVSKLTPLVADGTITPELIPRDIATTDEQRAILTTAMVNRSDSMADIRRKVNEKIDGSVSYSTVRNYLRETVGFKAPAMDSDTDSDSEESTDNNTQTMTMSQTQTIPTDSTDSNQPTELTPEEKRALSNYATLGEKVRLAVDMMTLYDDAYLNGPLTKTEVSDSFGIYGSLTNYVQDNYPEILHARKKAYALGKTDPKKDLRNNPNAPDSELPYSEYVTPAGSIEIDNPESDPSSEPTNEDESQDEAESESEPNQETVTPSQDELVEDAAGSTSAAVLSNGEDASTVTDVRNHVERRLSMLTRENEMTGGEASARSVVELEAVLELLGGGDE